MRLVWIELRDFRNYREERLRPPEGITVLVGPNGHGKTNLLEAMSYACSLESPRVSSDLPLVRTGVASAFLRAEVEAEGGRLLIEVEVRRGGQNRVQLNRSPVRRRRDVRRHARTVFCGPDALRLVEGEPDQRRRFMDEAVRSLWPTKEGTASAYERVLRQRNRLLKDGGAATVEPPGLEAWDDQLVAAGVLLTEARGAAVEELRERAGLEFEAVFGHRLAVAYRPSVLYGSHLAPEEAFRGQLRERRQDELVRRTTLVGPHRDELELSVEGLTARGFASHGQAWTAAVSLHLALAEAILSLWGERPLLLLDDPFSGLDPERRARLARGLAGRGQVVLAVPDRSHVPAGSTEWVVRHGAVDEGAVGVDGSVGAPA